MLQSKPVRRGGEGILREGEGTLRGGEGTLRGGEVTLRGSDPVADHETVTSLRNRIRGVQDRAHMISNIFSNLCRYKFILISHCYITKAHL